MSLAVILLLDLLPISCSQLKQNSLKNTESDMKNFKPANLADPLNNPIVKVFLICLLVLFILSVFLLSWVPPISRDALTHHLAIPKLYLQHGGIYEIPSIHFSYYPMNLDLLYMIPLYLGDDIAPKIIHFMFALLTAWLINNYLKRRLGAGWALLGALFFLSIPIIIKLSITVYVDLGLVFFSTASIMSLLKWIDSHFQLKYLVFSAISCGLALGTKYNGLLVLFILAVFIPFIYIVRIKRIAYEEKETTFQSTKRSQLKAIGFGILFCIIALAVFSPWMVKNYIWKGNPVYPLYDSWFNPPKGIPHEIIADNSKDKLNEDRPKNERRSSVRWSSFAIRSVIYEESWWEIALIPIRIFFQGQDNHPKYFDGRLTPFLIMLPFLAFLPSKNASQILRDEKRIFLLYSLLYFFVAFFQTDMRIRYITPIIPPLVILAMIGMKRIEEMGANHKNLYAGKLIPGTIILIAIVMLLTNTNYLYNQFKFVDPFDYIRGRISRDDYIGKYVGEYPVLQFANKNLNDDAKILAIFLGYRRYYSDRELVFGKNLFRKLAKNADSSAKMATEIGKLGFTHLLIRYDLFGNWSNVQFNENEKEMLRKFFKEHLTTVFSQSGYGLMRLESNKIFQSAIR